MITTDTTKPTSASANEKWTVFTTCLMSRFSPPSNMIMMSASAAKYGTTWTTASGWMSPNTGPITTPSTIKNATSGMPVFLKNASPATPKNITTPATSSMTWAGATRPSWTSAAVTEAWNSASLSNIMPASRAGGGPSAWPPSRPRIERTVGCTSVWPYGLVKNQPRGTGPAAHLAARPLHRPAHPAGFTLNQAPIYHAQS